MKALVLAAGLGKRMRPLTYEHPKPLLMADNHHLIDWAIAGLVRAGVTDLVINAAHLSSQFEPTLGKSRLGAKLSYSIEGETWDDALETLGGIAKTFPLLTDGVEPFIVVAGDIASDFDFSRLTAKRDALVKGDIDAHLVLVPNPDFHPEGDMGLEEGFITRASKTYTFSSIGIYSPRIFKGISPTNQKLFPWLYQWIDQKRVTGEIFEGFWQNVGTPDALNELSDACRLGKVPTPHVL